MKIIRAMLFALVALTSTSLLAQGATSASTNMEILRGKLKADKKLVVAANMQLTDAEAKAFWPVYDAYQADLDQINRRIGALVKTYAEVYNKAAVSDDVAKKLLAESLAIEEAEGKLKRAYVARFEKVVPGIKLARYYQIESKIRAIVRYDLAAGIPLVE